MAISPLNILKEFSNRLESDDADLNIILHAMYYSKTTDSIMEGLDIIDLIKNSNKKTLKKYIDLLIPKYEKLSEFLENPRTYEDWVESFMKLKTRRLGAYRKILHSNVMPRIDFWDMLHGES